ncbi:unnamed protein product [Schistosoma bovis]|nr:unnamed protein product [Schistosoma bovis]
MDSNKILLRSLFLLSVIILQEVNGRTGTGVIFNLEQLILDLWKNLYERLAETFRCLLNALPVYLGVVLTLSLIFLEGINVVSGEGVIFDVRTFFLECWSNLCSRLKGTFDFFLENLQKKYGGQRNS